MEDLEKGASLPLTGEGVVPPASEGSPPPEGAGSPIPKKVHIWHTDSKESLCGRPLSIARGDVINYRREYATCSRCLSKEPLPRGN